MTETPMGTWDAVRLIAVREIVARGSSKVYRISSVIMVLAVVGSVIAAKLIGDGDTGSTVGFTPPVASLAAPFQAVVSAAGEEVTTSAVDEATGERRVRDGELDVLVTGTPAGLRVVVEEDLAEDLRAALTGLARQIALDDQVTRLGGDPAAVNGAVGSASFALRTLEPPRQHEGARLLLAIVVGVLVYIAIMIYGQIVAQGVVEEKASRIVEILLTTIRPWQLMAGKVLGIGLVGLAQLAAVMVAGVATGYATDSFAFPSALAGTAALWAVVWFLLGYLVYALVFAALGALVSRQEDVGGVTAPAVMLIVLPYVAGATILPADPDNGFVALLSLIPFFAPMLMPMRSALDVAPLWQEALSIGLTLLLIVALVWLSGRVYGNAVLRMGGRVRFKDALRSH
jgi:ABC-2 type transport system permease protein